MQMREFLKAVASGKNGFHAAGNLVSDLSAFQSTVQTAQEAYESGYINLFKPHQESYSSHRFTDAFLAGELTGEGQDFITAP